MEFLNLLYEFRMQTVVHLLVCIGLFLHRHRVPVSASTPGLTDYTAQHTLVAIVRELDWALRSGRGYGQPVNVTSLPFRAGFYTGNSGTKTTRMKCDQIKATAHHLLGEWTKALV